MRLKTLRKERPAFENEGAVISGSRMDLSNSDFKPTKHRTNNTFALPTSLNTEVSFLSISPSQQTPELQSNNHHQTVHKRRSLLLSTPSQPTHVSTYQAIEAAYLEHGIRIHLNPSTATVVTQQQQQNASTENLARRKSATNIQRNKVFVHRAPSRSSSALHYSTAIHDSNQDSRPFSALQQTSTIDFEPINDDHILYTQPTANQNHVQSTEQLNNHYCTSSIVASEHFDHDVQSSQLAIANGPIEATATALINNDPDLAYMSSLLQTTTGDTFRDTIRRRAGLRATFAVHRHPQYSIPTTGTNSKMYEGPPLTRSPTTNHRSSILRNSTIAVTPTTTTPSPKKLERDILKHASRMRTTQFKDSISRQHNSLRSQTSDYTVSVSTSPTRLNYAKKRNDGVKSTKMVSLEPLELLLASSPQPTPPPPPSPTRATSLLLYDRPAMYYNNHHQEQINSSKRRTKSPKISFLEHRHHATTNFFLNEHINPSLLSEESLPLMKTPSLDMVTNDGIPQSNSIDSGCYDRSTSSTDTHSLMSLTINQASSSLPSARLTSASTRRSHINKKVSFEDQPSTVIITTATYV